MYGAEDNPDIADWINQPGAGRISARFTIMHAPERVRDISDLNSPSESF
jgi:hypothetical protein